MIRSLLALILSGICGFACAIIRLCDFRGTAQRARKKPDAPSHEYLAGLGRTTWVLFYFHLAAFVLGVALLGTALWLTYCGKLV